jgi:UDP-N-acetylmuramoyl-tripeptide--D-alanyl-D-alanine ligase
MTMFTLGDLWEGVTGEKLERPLVLEFKNGVINSRLAEKGSLFVALRGEDGDGHDYVKDAFERGALAALVEREIEGYPLARVKDPSSFPSSPEPFCLLVEDSLRALQDLAAYWRRKFDLRVIGVTGSTGKTTTKETIWSVLRKAFTTLKSEANYNNEIGLPLTLLNLDESYQKVVLEMGMYDLGEIARLAEISQPQVGVITNVSHSHLERLKTLVRIAQAKAELVEALPSNGVAILNGDEPRVKALAQKTEAKVFFYGLSPDCDLWASDIESRGLQGVHFNLHHGEETLHVRIPLLGRHSVHAALAAAAVGLVEGEPWDQIVAGLQDIAAQLRLIAVPGIKGSTIIDDTYNASPASTLAALNLLADLEGRKIAVLGDMLELGSFEEKGHRLVGRRAAETVDKLVTVGPRGRIIAQEARALGMDEDDLFAVESNQEAVEVLRRLIASGDLILIKGSRGMKMEEIVAELGGK